jgi:hypothetical protein
VAQGTAPLPVRISQKLLILNQTSLMNFNPVVISIIFFRNKVDFSATRSFCN